jgi:hypothetical protein
MLLFYIVAYKKTDCTESTYFLKMYHRRKFQDPTLDGASYVSISEVREGSMLLS